DRPGGRGARGADLPRDGRGAGRTDPARGVLPPGGAGHPGRRLQHPLPAEPPRGSVPPRPRPRARRRRPFARLLTRSSTVPQFKLPDPGEGLVEAEIVTWKVKVGDEVKVNDIVVEIETAKSLVELPIPWAGTVSELLVEEGTTVEVGDPIIVIDTGDQEAAPAGPSGDAAAHGGDTVGQAETGTQAAPGESTPQEEPTREANLV